MNSKYNSKNYKQSVLSIKEAANWKCQICNCSCYNPNKKLRGITKSEWAIKTLTIYYQNYNFKENELENPIAICTTCHIAIHSRKNINIIN